MSAEAVQLTPPVPPSPPRAGVSFAGDAGVVSELVAGQDEAAGGSGGHAAALAWCGEAEGRHVAWVGRRAWPAAEALRRAGLLGRSLLVDATSVRERLWAAELCAGAGELFGTVVADGAGFDLTATRRLQLAVRGRDVRLVLLRPASEARAASAAGVRWRVTPVAVTSGDEGEAGPRRPAWDVTLLRRKGPRPVLPEAGELPAGLSLGDEDQHLLRWRVRWDAAAGVCRPDARPRQPDEQPRPVRFAANALALRLPLGLPANVAGRPAAPRLAAVG